MLNAHYRIEHLLIDSNIPVAGLCHQAPAIHLARHSLPIQRHPKPIADKVDAGAYRLVELRRAGPRRTCRFFKSNASEVFTNFLRLCPHSIGIFYVQTANLHCKETTDTGLL
jgi:hypothetical protein